MLEDHYSQQLKQEMGVADYVKEAELRCDWSKSPYMGADANGWVDGKYCILSS